jgi:uncharacterized protein (TIGR02453 family)
MLALSVDTFPGFSPDLVDFLSLLRGNNSREWFNQGAHREQYQRVLLEPARSFVMSMADLLPRLGTGLHAEPRVHGSILAINRDTRFSPDKTPYKTHLDLWFWQGDGPSRERPGYFVRLEVERLILGAGMHAFTADGALDRYREAVLDPTTGEQLVAAVNAVGPDLVKGRTYSRVPRGLPADHPRADWLRHSGLFAEVTIQPLPRELFTPAFPDYCLEQFERFRLVLQWLVDLLPT